MVNIPNIILSWPNVKATVYSVMPPEKYVLFCLKIVNHWCTLCDFILFTKTKEEGYLNIFSKKCTSKYFDNNLDTYIVTLLNLCIISLIKFNLYWRTS